MKKYRVTRYYVGMHIACIILAISPEVIYLIFGVDESINFYDLLPERIVSAFILFCVIYSALTDFQFAKFSFSDEGISLYFPLKKYEYLWSDFTSAGIVLSHIQKGSFTAWVYFSKTPLTSFEKRKFLSKTRRQLDRLVYFQYDKEEVLNMVLEKLPENLRNDLLADIMCVLK